MLSSDDIGEHMGLQTLIKKIVDPNHASNEAFIDYLRRNGVRVGDHTIIYSPRSTTIDIQKPHILSIGSYCKITSGVVILAHDYSISVARRVYGDFIGGTAPTRIGDNCFLGIRSIILPGVTLGNNCIVGSGSVVPAGVYPDNSVIAGNPAKIICTLDEYYKKHKDKWISDAKRCALEIYKNTGRKPTVDEMRDGFYWLYTPRTEENIHNHEYFFKLTGDDYDDICKHFLSTQPVYASFDDFLKDCGIE